MAESDSSGEDITVEEAANESDMDIAQCLPLVWTKAVWLEREQEEECTVPSSWVDKVNKLVFWPPGKDAVKKLRERALPTDQWLQFPLLKCKIRSGNCMAGSCYYTFSNATVM